MPENEKITVRRDEPMKYVLDDGMRVFLFDQVRQAVEQAFDGCVAREKRMHGFLATTAIAVSLVTFVAVVVSFVLGRAGL